MGSVWFTFKLFFSKAFHYVSYIDVCLAPTYFEGQQAREMERLMNRFCCLSEGDNNSVQNCYNVFMERNRKISNWEIYTGLGVYHLI